MTLSIVSLVFLFRLHFLLTTMWVMWDPSLPMQSVGSYASISCAADWSSRLSRFPWLLAYLVWYLSFKFYFFVTAPLVVWDSGLAMKLGRVLHIHFPCWLFWDPELARQSGGILHIDMWVVSTTFLLARAFYFSLFLVVSGEAFLWSL